MTATLWSPEEPNRCACGDVYEPRLVNGKLVVSREPAWQLPEVLPGGGKESLTWKVIAVAHAYQLACYHVGISKNSVAGYPDLHAWGPGLGSLFCELKRMGKDPTVAQVGKMAGLRGAGHPVYLARTCCLLVGAIDEMMAGFAGARCRYTAGHPQVAQAPGRSATPTPGPAPALGRRPPPVALPGGELGAPFPGAAGYVVPLAATLDDRAAGVRDLEVWLRDAGFPIVHVPWPVKFVVGAGVVAVLVRTGLARDGQRVWRGGVPARPFPEDLPGRLCAAAITDLSSDRVMSVIEDAACSGDLSLGHRVEMAPRATGKRGTDVERPS